jgi:hypothetical protein
VSISILRVNFRPPKGFVGHTTYSGYKASDEEMDAFVCSWLNKVIKMPDYDYSGCFKGQGRQIDSVNEAMAPGEDVTMEQILDNINNTSLGQVLKRIASLPDVRREKILRVRRQLTEGKYDLSTRLNVALDKVLEDLTA